MKATALQTTQKKNRKIVTSNQLTIILKLYAECVRLDLDRGLCIGCDICSRACPTEAISVRLEHGKLVADVDEDKCVLCELCTAFCPTGALSMEENGQPKMVLKLSGAVAEARPKLVIDQTACPRGCDPCVSSCPRKAISFKLGKVMVNEEACLRCPYCVDACPHGAARVEPLFEGRLTIDSGKCPADCNDCIDLCPTKAIKREGEVVRVLDRYCVLCGACVNACSHGAVSLRRTWMYAGPGFSAAWSEAVGRLTAPRTLASQLSATSFKRTVDAFAKTKPIAGPPVSGGDGSGR